MSTTPVEESTHQPPLALKVLAIAGLLLAIGVVLYSCLAALRSPPLADAAIREVLDQQSAAWNRGDLPAFMTGYHQSPHMTFYSEEKKEQGWQQAYDRYKARYQGTDKEMGQLSFTELEIDHVGPDTALVRGRWKLLMKREQPEGLFTLLMKKTPEGWRIVHDHTSAKPKDK